MIRDIDTQIPIWISTQGRGNVSAIYETELDRITEQIVHNPHMQ